MKAVVACLVLFAVCALAYDCPDYSLSCAKTDGTCSYKLTSDLITYVQCSDNQRCNATGTATDYTGNCYTLRTSGQTCDAGTLCADGYFCDAGKCAAKTYNVATGAACSATKICSVNNYCGVQNGSAVCVAAVAAGGDCSTGSCVLGQTCSPAKKCIGLFSVAVGGDCSDDETCVGGAYCSTTGKCVANKASSKADCTSSGTCSSSDETCVSYCKSTKTSFSKQCIQTSYGPSTSQADAVKSFESCQASNNEVCQDYTSCTKCFDKQCDADEGDDLTDGYTASVPTCGNHQCSSSATTIAVSAILLIAALFVAM